MTENDDSMSQVGTRKAKRKSPSEKKKKNLAESAGPQARGPERSGRTFRAHCIKVPATPWAVPTTSLHSHRFHDCLRKPRREEYCSRDSVAATMTIRVVAGIIEQDGRVLICQRRAGAIFGGKWEFPGGKMRPSETPREALQRELREELGSAPNIGNLLQMVRYRYAEMSEAVQILFLSAALDDPPRNLAFERIIWARRAELPRYDFLAADRRVISRLVRGEI
jgi:8-oxo-dGTP diphosphatase